LSFYTATLTERVPSFVNPHYGGLALDETAEFMPEFRQFDWAMMPIGILCHR
jgi:hypothetical protein